MLSMYTADPIRGFNAVGHKEPLVVKVAVPVIAKITAPEAHASHTKIAAPLTYSPLQLQKSPSTYTYYYYYINLN